VETEQFIGAFYFTNLLDLMGPNWNELDWTRFGGNWQLLEMKRRLSMKMEDFGWIRT